MKSVSLLKKCMGFMSMGLVVSLIFSSCGGGGTSLPKNAIIGDVPSIAAEYHEAKAKLEAEGDKTAEKLKDNESQDAWMKAMKEYAEKESAIEKKKESALEKTVSEIKGNLMPVVNDNPLVDVKDLKLDYANEARVGFEGIATVKEEIKEPYINCRFQDEEGNVIQETVASIVFNKVWANDMVPAEDHKVIVDLDIKDMPAAANVAKVVFLP